MNSSAFLQVMTANRIKNYPQIKQMIKQTDIYYNYYYYSAKDTNLSFGIFKWDFAAFFLDWRAFLIHRKKWRNFKFYFLVTENDRGNKHKKGLI